MWYIINFVFGALFGSFLNVIIYRSVEGISIINPPRSFCPICKTTLKWYDNIPILSYIFLRGKCRYCGAKIPLRYLIVELVPAFGFLIHSLFFSLPVTLILNSLLFITIAVIYIDLKIMMIPDFAWLIVGFAAILDIFLHGELFLRVIAFSTVLIILLILKFRYKDGMGSGDIFLMSAFSLLLSIPLAFYMMVLSSILGILFAIFKKSKIIPFGPFISLSGYFLYMFSIIFLMR
ncbi:prepilin peptidase [Thermosipho atlanticus]|uniref:Leader peptidase (Prepilin peptidase) / N-methyltransferase n=1 Tax=Thermosipho atlanticus DSM 15807 TaxID=1123380 RepID=A0A1M5SPQ7_9BACT|nr:A24 family peptidase [Thermosipho atlanticus]SHH40511.1 leader peptidase (prepilin peptidase) / N-methyltransferase [Thermosipho atlanticus DSM 15807]